MFTDGSFGGEPRPDSEPQRPLPFAVRTLEVPAGALIGTFITIATGGIETEILINTGVGALLGLGHLACTAVANRRNAES